MYLFCLSEVRVGSLLLCAVSVAGPRQKFLHGLERRNPRCCTVSLQLVFCTGFLGFRFRPSSALLTGLEGSFRPNKMALGGRLRATKRRFGMAAKQGHEKHLRVPRAKSQTIVAMRLEPRKSCLIFVGLPGTTKQTSSAVKQLHQNKRQCLFGYDAGPWTGANNAV